jgi:translocation and assembly module TamA
MPVCHYLGQSVAQWSGMGASGVTELLFPRRVTVPPTPRRAFCSMCRFRTQFRILLGMTVCTLLAALFGEAAAQEAPVRVELVGIRGAERRNVMASLSIALSGSEHIVSESRVRRLHARALGEIELALQPFGYYRPHVESSLRYEGHRWIARYVIDPEARVVVAQVAIEITGDGSEQQAFRRAVAAYPLAVGDPLSHAAYELGKTRLVNTASQLGYLDAGFERSELRISLESYTAEIDLVYNTGPRFRFGPVTFDQEIVDPELLRSSVNFRQGEPFSITPLLDLQTTLGDSPYFSRVEVVPRRDLADGLDVPVEVHLVARRPQRYEFGVGYGTNTGPRGSFEVEFRRLNRSGHRANAQMSVSLIEKRLSGRYVIPLPYARTHLFSLAGGFARLTPTTSSSDVVLASATLGRSRGRWQETIALTFQFEDFVVGSDTGKADILMPSVSWSFTDADDRLYPSRGIRVRLEVSGAARGVGSSASFGTLSLGGKFIRSLLPRTRVLVRLDLGGTVTSQLRELPPSLRFFAGGDQSVRGYAFQSLGPMDQFGNVIGGRALAVASLELEQRFLRQWGVAAFIDAGNALDGWSGHLEQGVGGGIRWLSPVGLVRFDLAVAVSQAGNPIRFHVTIGPDL